MDLYIFYWCCSIREGRGAVVRAWRFAMSLIAVRFQTPLGAGFSEKYHVFPFSMLKHCSDVVSLSKALYPHVCFFTNILSILSINRCSIQVLLNAL